MSTSPCNDYEPSAPCISPEPTLPTKPSNFRLHSLVILIPLLIASLLLLKRYEFIHLTSQVAQSEVLSSYTEIDPLNPPLSSMSPILIKGPIETDSDHLYDDFFGLSFPHCLRVDRRVAYCQWMEHAVSEQNDNEELSSRTYSYSLGWSHVQIPSLLFHEPLSHHNPLRVDLPSIKQTVSGGKMGSVFIPGDIISKLSSFSSTDLDLSYFPSSFAYTDHSFGHVEKGLFYSSYEPSLWSSIISLVGTFTESINFDGLFAQCNAGDVKVLFTCVPTEILVSIIGGIENGKVVPIKLSTGQPVLIVRVGDWSAEKMLDSAIFYANLKLICARIFVFMMVYFVFSKISNQNFGFISLPVVFIAVFNFIFGYSSFAKLSTALCIVVSLDLSKNFRPNFKKGFIAIGCLLCLLL
ncbi:hypothetical protein RCL1_005721 [Eukaryota sp. TZLM3-RCL]